MAAVAVVAVKFVGFYGYVLFLGGPLLLGFVASAIAAREGSRSYWEAARFAGLAGVIVAFGWLAVGAEG